MPNNRCTNCITFNQECTYVEAAKVCLLWFCMVNRSADVGSRNEGLRKGMSRTRQSSEVRKLNVWTAMSKGSRPGLSKWRSCCSR